MNLRSRIALLGLLLVLVGCVPDAPSGAETYDDHLAMMKYAEVQGRKLAYIDEGTGKPIVLIHGIPTSSWMYRKIIPGLVDAGYRVIAPDLMGMGASERLEDPGELTVRKQSEYLIELLADRLKLDEWSHVVHDFGGPITWEMMEDPRFRIDRLIILDTFAFEKGWSPGLNVVTKNMTRIATSRPFDRAFYTMAIKGMVQDKALANTEMIDGYCHPLADGGGFTFETLYFTANELKKELPRYQRNLARYKNHDVKIIWGRHDPFLSSTLQLDQFKELLEVEDEHVLLLESAKHLIADEEPESIVRFIR